MNLKDKTKRIEEEKNVERQQKEAERLAKAEAAKALAEKQAAEAKALEAVERQKEAERLAKAEAVKALEKQAANLGTIDVVNDSGDLQVIGASWGKNDVLSAVQSLLRNGNGKTFTPSSSQLGDGLPGWKKVLYVVLKSKSTEQFYSVVVPEGSSFSTANRQSLPTPSVGRNGISIIGANYGPADVTSKVRSIYSTGSIGANNGVFGDTWFGVYKTMTIVYKSGSSYYTRIGMEGEYLL